MKFRSDRLPGRGQLDSGLNEPADAGVVWVFAGVAS
jgi:hypothetical protein